MVTRKPRNGKDPNPAVRDPVEFTPLRRLSEGSVCLRSGNAEVTEIVRPSSSCPFI